MKARARLHRWVGEEPERGTWHKTQQRARPMESPLHADYQAEFEQTRQKKQLHAQINQRLISKIHPGQSFPADPAASADAADPCHGSGRAPPLPWDPLHSWDLVLSKPQEQVYGCPHPQNVLPGANHSNCKGIHVFQVGKCCSDTLGRGFPLPCSPKWAESKII